MNIFKHITKTVGIFAVSISLAGAADKAATETNKVTETRSSEKAAAKVPAALKGKLIGLKDGKIQDANIPANVDYYLLYHSASW